MGYKSLAQMPARRNGPVSSNVRRHKLRPRLGVAAKFKTIWRRHKRKRNAGFLDQIFTMNHYLNNCQNCDHAKAYARDCSDAFFDLYTTGRDEKYLPSFQSGDECIVATKVKKGKGMKGKVHELVRLSRYRLDRTFKVKYVDEVETFVLCGPLISTETMTKTEAAINKKYSRFFNKVGHFKQASVFNDA